ncbi:MAG: hypothetical protein FWH26_04840 [Oscillospiraceae bacterium]|nr:hypothetical protein [Oscillospiraceae bacterium]
MKLNKRILSALLAVMVVFGALSVSAGAATIYETTEQFLKLRSEVYFLAGAHDSHAPYPPFLPAAIEQGFLNFLVWEQQAKGEPDGWYYALYFEHELDQVEHTTEILRPFFADIEASGRFYIDALYFKLVDGQITQEQLDDELLMRNEYYILEGINKLNALKDLYNEFYPASPATQAQCQQVSDELGVIYTGMDARMELLSPADKAAVQQLLQGGLDDANRLGLYLSHLISVDLWEADSLVEMPWPIAAGLTPDEYGRLYEIMRAMTTAIQGIIANEVNPKIPPYTETVETPVGGITATFPWDAFGEDNKPALSVTQTASNLNTGVLPSGGFIEVPDYCFNIKFEPDNQQPLNGAKVTVCVPFPSGLDPDRLEVFHFNSQGQYVPMVILNRGTARTDGFLKFETDHFSVYLLAEKATYSVSYNGLPYGDYPAGETVTLTTGATLSDGSRFLQWSFSREMTFTEGTDATKTTVKFLMPAQDIAVTPVYSTIYAVTVNGASIGSYAAGETVTLTAQAPQGGSYRFVRWDVSPSVSFVEGTGAASETAKFTMPAGAVTATAVFESVPLEWWEKLPVLIQWLLRIFAFGWAWMKTG